MRAIFIFLMAIFLMVHLSGCTIHRTKQEIVEMKETIEVLQNTLEAIQADTQNTNQTTDELENQLIKAKDVLSAERAKLNKIKSGIPENESLKTELDNLLSRIDEYENEIANGNQNSLAKTIKKEQVKEKLKKDIKVLLSSINTHYYQ